MPSDADKIQIGNVNSPGRVERVDRAKYVAMKEALLSVLPKNSPGLTVAEAKANFSRFRQMRSSFARAVACSNQ